MTTWILTASPDNHAATAAHGFEVIGLKERKRKMALEVAEGDTGGLRPPTPSPVGSGHAPSTRTPTALGRMRDGSPALGR